eukprot:1322510-Amorphochlora_amoeboformis.AAC.2
MDIQPTARESSGDRIQEVKKLLKLLEENGSLSPTQSQGQIGTVRTLQSLIEEYSRSLLSRPFGNNQFLHLKILLQRLQYLAQRPKRQTYIIESADPGADIKVKTNS